MDNATTKTSPVSYNDLMVGDSVYIPCEGTFFSVAWVGGGTVALETGGDHPWHLTGCEDGHFAVAA